LRPRLNLFAIIVSLLPVYDIKGPNVKAKSRNMAALSGIIGMNMAKFHQDGSNAIYTLKIVFLLAVYHFKHREESKPRLNGDHRTRDYVEASVVVLLTPEKALS